MKSGGGKDSAEVVRFMALFATLKTWSDDDPAALPALAKHDEGVRDLCDQLFWAADALRVNERRRRDLFVAPVDPKFHVAWRDFEVRFEDAVANVFVDDIIPMLDVVEPNRLAQAELRWQVADVDGAEQARAIEEAIDFAFQEATDEHRNFREEFREDIKDGAAAWDRLKNDAEFDLRGVFRRRAMVPFVLVPRHVAEKYGQKSPLSMLRCLRQAHEAFVFGASFAALALMRSTTEAVLRDHYGAAGGDLSEYIRSVRHKLPRAANEGALHRLRKRANAILHLDNAEEKDLPNIDDTQLEREIVSLLLVLRALIEYAPQRGSR